MQDGRLTASRSFAVNDKGGVLVNSLQPLVDGVDAKITIFRASLMDPVISGGIITGAESVNTGRLEVTGAVEIAGHTYIGSSLNVHGSVVGSGPYMDSSDSRFKIGVKKVKGALQKVLALDAVS